MHFLIYSQSGLRNTPTKDLFPARKAKLALSLKKGAVTTWPLPPEPGAEPGLQQSSELVSKPMLSRPTLLYLELVNSTTARKTGRGVTLRKLNPERESPVE